VRRGRREKRPERKEGKLEAGEEGGDKMGKDPVGEGSRRRKGPASWRRRGSEYLDAVRPTRAQRKRKSLKEKKNARRRM